jgi:hypothetical protein
MKRFFLSLCFVTFLSAGLVSCADEAAEITPQNEINETPYATDGSTDSEKPTKPGS